MAAVWGDFESSSVFLWCFSYYSWLYLKKYPASCLFIFQCWHYCWQLQFLFLLQQCSDMALGSFQTGAWIFDFFINNEFWCFVVAGDDICLNFCVAPIVSMDKWGSGAVLNTPGNETKVKQTGSKNRYQSELNTDVKIKQEICVCAWKCTLKVHESCC